MKSKSWKEKRDAERNSMKLAVALFLIQANKIPQARRALENLSAHHGFQGLPLGFLDLVQFAKLGELHSAGSFARS